AVCSLGVFFFQAEDGIRDFHVTGVQTCALPISFGGVQLHALQVHALGVATQLFQSGLLVPGVVGVVVGEFAGVLTGQGQALLGQIGRASGRESGVAAWVGAGVNSNTREALTSGA